MTAAVSRQVRRAEERRASKPAPGPVALTSPRHLAVRTKGRAYSRHMLVDVHPTPMGMPSVFELKHPTKKYSGRKFLNATPELIKTFFPSLPPEMFAYHMGH